MFHCLGIDNQAFGTVAESEEKWTQRTKTQWETSWKSKTLLNNSVASFEFLQNALREKMVKEKLFLEERRQSNSYLHSKSLQIYQELLH